MIQSRIPEDESIKRKPAYSEMDLAIEEFEQDNGISYWKATVMIAMKLAQQGKTALLCKVLDKFVATKIEVAEEEDAPESLPFVVMGPNAN